MSSHFVPPEMQHQNLTPNAQGGSIGIGGNLQPNKQRTMEQIYSAMPNMEQF